MARWFTVRSLGEVSSKGETRRPTYLFLGLIGRELTEDLAKKRDKRGKRGTPRSDLNPVMPH